MESNHRDPENWVQHRLATLTAVEDWRPDSTWAWSRLTARSDAGRRGRRAWISIATAAAVICCSLLGFPLTRVLAERCVHACVAETSRMGQFLWHSRQPSGRTGISERGRAIAPDFILKDASGDPVQLSKFKGKVVLLNFWATWCGPCKVEIPWFIDFQRTYGTENLIVVGISLDGDGWKIVKPFADAHGINYRVVLGSEDVWSRYGAVESLPRTFMLDRSGHIAATSTGLIDKAKYEEQLKSLLAER
jgi:peroxiredoxin